MNRDDNRTIGRRVSRRNLLEKSACTLAALTAAPWLASCAPVGDESDDTLDESFGALGPLAQVKLPKRVAGIRIPDTRLAVAAADLAFTVSPANLYNHCLRTYLFAALVFEKSGVQFDEELTFVSSALHDLGLVDEYMTPNERFEVDGADAALRFLKRFRLSSAKTEIVWDAIALHTAVGIAARKRPEIAAVSIGAGLDTVGMGLAELDPADVAAVLAVYPRLDFKKEAIASIIRMCEKKPAATVMTPLAEVGRKHIPNYPVPTLDESIASSPFLE